jgi:outer membrane protein assembly factor BamB
VWADQPVDFRSSLSPFWAYRRWPATLLGVVAVGATVVSRWSDGDLVALDATRGTIAWRVRVPTVEGGYPGRRTGAAAVYQPVGMYTAGSVVIVVGDAGTRAYDAASGRPLWTKTFPRCGSRAYFTGGAVFVAVARCEGTSTVDAFDPGTGTALSWPALGGDVEPVSCTAGRSGCRGVRTPANAWVIGADGGLTAAPALVDPGSWLVDGVVVAPGPDGTVVGRAAGGRQLWSWPLAGPVPRGARIVAVERGAVHLLTDDRYLISVDPADGLELSRLPLIDTENGRFDPGHVYAADRFVFVERLKPGAKATDPDPRYYYPSPNVLVVGT